MQRPLHARVYNPGESTQPQQYYPFYPPVSPNGLYALYPAGAGYGPGPLPPQDTDKVLPSQPTPLANSIGSKMRQRPPNPKNLKKDHDQMPVYNAPITYGHPVKTNEAYPTRGKRHRNTAPIADQRTAKSSPMNEYGPDHVFLSLSSVHTLKIKGTVPEALIRQQVLPLWWGGVQTTYKSRDYWVIRFKGKPWTADGEDGFRGRRLVCRLFEILGNNGCSYVSAVASTSMNHSPTLIFARTPAYFASDFFCLSFSRSRQDLYIIDAPSHLVGIITAATRASFPTSTEGTKLSEGVYGMRLTTTQSVKQHDLPPRFSLVFRAITAQGYRLEATVAMGREGFLGMGGRRELWIFRNNVPVVYS
ncbi:hypothetical protein BS47DRAFT_1317208 [Hydnum rufescens UP504]|uniref:Uncharacterized protein n=1 Tax=Hydnum rufescens UP504 TaxID=1448309 RepID=A0A9P6AXZ2_9AGAM|nr:hypothetical protein BS47DRAFT_1317208 [Hydnum rufescens UP504]